MSNSLSIKILKNVFWNFFGNSWLILLTFFTTPYVVKKLDVNLYGVYVLISTIIAYFTFLQLGLRHAGIKFIAQYLAKDDKTQIRNVFWTNLLMYLFLGSLGSLSIFFFAKLFVVKLLAIPDNYINDAIIAIKIGAWVFLPSILEDVTDGVLRACLRFDLINKISVIFGTLQLLITVLLLYTGFSLKEVVFSNVSLLFIKFFISAFLAVKQLPYLIKPSINFITLKEMLKFGGFISVISLTQPIVNNIEKLFLSSNSVSSVTFYYIPQTIISKLAIIPSAIFSVLFPLFSKYNESKEGNLNEELFIRSIIYLQIIYVFIMFFILFEGKAFLLFWMGQEFALKSAGILTILTLAGIFTAASQPSITLLLGTGRPNFVAFSNVLITIIYLPLCFYFTKQYGGTGASFAWLIISFINFTILSSKALNILNVNPLSTIIKILKPLLLPAFFSAIAFWLLGSFNYYFLNPFNISACCLIGAIYFLIVWHVSLDNFAKNKFKEFFMLFINKFKPAEAKP